MVTLPQGFTELTDEFSLLDETAAEAGVPGAQPRVRRSWVNVPTGGHVSGVIWGSGPPELVFLHDSGQSARAWDTVALAARRPSVAIDLPGHGRSDWRRDARYEPGKITSAVAEAIRSFAPRARLVAGAGLGGLTALTVQRRQPRLVPAIALINTLPGVTPDRVRPGQSAERFASREEALVVLAARRPEHGRAALRREILFELIQDPDGAWVWRHHPGNLPAPPDSGLGAGLNGATSASPDAGRDELAQLFVPVTLIRSKVAGPLTPDEVARLRQRAPQVGVVTIPGAGWDIAGTAPGALAAALDDLLPAER